MTAFDVMRETLTAVAQELLAAETTAEDDAIARAQSALYDSDFMGASVLLSDVACSAGRLDLLDRIATFS